MELKELLAEHIASHPAAGPADAVKFIYQSEFGGGHLIKDPAAALARLEEETDGVPASDGPVSEPLGGGLCRLSLGAAKGRLSSAALCAMFTETAAAVRGSGARFAEELELVRGLGFPEKDVSDYLAAYRAAGCPAVSHSAAYRAAYAPAYRVVRQRYADFFTLFAAIDALLARGGTVIVGIDGGCASGKTALGELLAGVYDMNLFHADDYFLPFDMRTPERLSEPGGNMHRERLRDEALEPVRRGGRAVTRAFDCGTCLLGGPTAHPAKALNAVEGSYSLHPELRGYYDLRVFLKTDGDSRRARLLARCGEEGLRRFETRWIPLEEKYFAACGPEECADLVFET